MATDAEITPPLFFVLAKLARGFGSAPELIRLPSMLAGILLVPVIFGIGRIAVGRRAACVAAAIASLSPFLIYFSGNARAYSVMLLMVAASTFCLLMAARDGHRRWWAGYAVFVCLAMYSHYTAAFILAGQFGWALWAMPAARKPLLAATALAALAFVPWLPSLSADLDSPTTDFLQGLEPHTISERWSAFEQVMFIRPGDAGGGFFSRPDVILAVLGIGLALAVLAVRVVRRIPVSLAEDEVEHGVSLVIVLTLAAPVASILLGLVGTDVSGIRELATTWVGLPLLAGMLMAATGRYWGLAATVLVLTGLTIGSVHLADASKSAFAYRDAAAWLDENADPSAVIVDDSSLSPSPATPLDAYLDRGRTEYRLRVPIDSPDYMETFTSPDPLPLITEAFSSGGEVFVVSLGQPFPVGADGKVVYRGQDLEIARGWRVSSRQSFDGVLPVTVTGFSRDAAAGSD